MKRFLTFLCAMFVCAIAFAHTIEWYVDDTVYQTTSCNSGDNITPPTAPEKYGYHLAEWKNFDFVQLEYIESTGTQYIDTGVTLKSDSQIKLVAAGEDGSPFGVNTPNNQYVMVSQSNSRMVYYRLFTAVGTGVQISEGKHTYTFIGNRAYYDGSHVYTGGTPTDSTLNIYLFARNVENNAETLFHGKIYLFEIDNYKFVPCRRKSNNVLGMCDTVRMQFLTNAGTGNFIAGPEVGDL